jgi:hypothetical protein
MATYGQWAKKRELKRVTWICGNEPVLIEEIVGVALVSADSHLSLTAGEEAEAEIWAAASSPLADPDAAQLVVIRSAQRLKRWDQLVPVLTARDLDQVRVLFVSSEEKLPRVRGDEEGRPVLPLHLAQLRDSRCGTVVECRVPEDWREAPDWLLDWASRQLGGADRAMSAQLLSSAGSVAAAQAVATKLRLAGVPASSTSIAGLTEPGGAFTEAVIANRRSEALLAAALLTREETGAAIGLLASRLDVLAALYTASERRLDGRETAVKLGVPSFLQMRFRQVAVSYSAARVRACRGILAVADEAWRSGAQDGVPEFVAALWCS